MVQYQELAFRYTWQNFAARATDEAGREVYAIMIAARLGVHSFARASRLRGSRRNIRKQTWVQNSRAADRAIDSTMSFPPDRGVRGQYLFLFLAKEEVFFFLFLKNLFAGTPQRLTAHVIIPPSFSLHLLQQ